jgi:glycosyltransferase involved in cell wall biosynthesis
MASPTPLRLTGGLVAYNEEDRIERAIGSLHSQELPPNVVWDRIVVVASGCTDQTVARARGSPGPVEVIEQVERRGKSAALVEVFRRARGDLLVLLNGDAMAGPGSVRYLLEAAKGLTGPFAVMARPVPEVTESSWTADGVHLLWEIHHRFYLEATRRGVPSNLSDELVLLPVAHLPPLEPSIVNDGGFIGGWLARTGHIRYEPHATVKIASPHDFSDYVRQRRRIRAGARQLESRWGTEPDTLSKDLIRHPRRPVDLIRTAVRAEPNGVLALSWLLAAESTSAGLALVDARRPPSELARWPRISARR